VTESSTPSETKESLLSQEEFAKAIDDFVHKIRTIKGEASRADRFRDFVRKVFPQVEAGGVKGFFPELEKYIKIGDTGQVVRGRADALFGSLLLEFEPILDDAHVKEAKDQLTKYVAGIWTRQAQWAQPRARLTAVATDGLDFIVYRPRSIVQQGPVEKQHVVLEEIDRADLSRLEAEDAYAWLNRYVVTAARELRLIDPDIFARDFGLESKIFADSTKLLQAGWKRADSMMLYEQWESHLRIVYGSEVGSKELYLRHTYLATLAKLIVYSAYSRGALPTSRDELVRILDGSIFREWRIINFIEEDLFSWVHRVDEGIRSAQLLVSSLSRYDLTTTTLDVFKEIYQELVDPEARHELGEYYTPDWLAEMITGDVLGDNPRKSVVDPACGSGTFLAAAIAVKKQRVRDLKPAELLNHILSNVVGVDVHPLAVIISRATYLTTLGELLDSRHSDVVVPVYLSDSIRAPEEIVAKHDELNVYRVRADGFDLEIPTNIAEKSELVDATIDAMCEYAKEISSGSVDDFAYYRSYVSSKVPEAATFSDRELNNLYQTTKNIADLIHKKRDTVWGFILKNYYKPVLLEKRRFSVVVGNPPWLSYRYVISTDYQQFLKKLIVDQYTLLPPKEVKEMPNLELATLFLVRCADLYSEKDGTICFVMPRAIFSADQHHNLRCGKLSIPIKLTRLVDLERVRPLFNVPACIIHSIVGKPTSFPVDGTVIEGTLHRKNVNLAQSLAEFARIQKTEFQLGRVGERSFIAEVGGKLIRSTGRSPYFEAFRRGGDIYPRQFWFVDIKAHPVLGFDPRTPALETSARATKRAKDEYRDVKITGSVEPRFLYGVLSASELVPFGHLRPLVAIVPLETEDKTRNYKLVTRKQARNEGFVSLEKWLKKVEEIWKKKRGEKADRADVYQWLDYQGKLTGQDSHKRFKVLYNRGGTDLVSCVAEWDSKKPKASGAKVGLAGLLADTTTYWMATNNLEEAHYLSAVLNSSVLNDMIKPMQSKGAFGERDIHKKPLEFPIPRYDRANQLHKRLADIGMECHRKVPYLLVSLTDKYTSIAKIRSGIRRQLQGELHETDSIVKKLFTDTMPSRQKTPSLDSS